MGYMLHWELGHPPHRTMGVPSQWEVGVYPQRELGYIPPKRTEITHTNINMHMKQFLQKGMATRLLGVLVAFFMMGSLTVKAQTSSFGGGSQFSGANSANALIQVTKPKPVASSYPTSSKTKDRPFTKADGGDLIQIGEVKYQSWNDAVEALKENDVITLLQNIELEWGDDTEPGFKIPKVACTIKGISTTTIFKSVSSIEMEAPITFKDVTLDLNELLACGNKLVFDENVTCTNQSMTVCGGSGFYEEGVEIKSTSITIKSGTFNKVYGGGFYVDVTGDTYIDVQGGTITLLYGGGLSGDIGGSTHVSVDNNATVGWLYGGGQNAQVAGTTNVEIESGNIDSFYGGGENVSAVCGNTNIIINNGVFGQINEYRYNLMGGGDAAPVTGKAKVTINGGTFNCFVTAGGGQNSNTTATCGSTELNITNGTFTKWTYGGGWASSVLETATVKVSGTPALITLCGGGVMSTAACENTDVQISSDINGWLYGGGEVGAVNGTAKLTVTDGRIANNIYGGCTSAFCNRTEVTISGGEAGGFVFGGGEGNGSVVNEANLTVSGGTFPGVCGSGFTSITTNPQPNGYVKDVNMLITGGAIDFLSITPTITADTPTPVTGKMSLTIEGNKTRIGSTISKNCHCPDKDKKEAVLTFKNCGTQNAPFETPCIDGFTTIKLDNSFVKPIKRAPYSGGELYAKPDMPFRIEGEGLIGNDMTIVYNSLTAPALGSPLFSMDNIPAGMTFKMLVGNPLSSYVIYETFKAGNYIFPAQTTPDDKLTLHDITITYPLNSTLSVQWDKIGLESGDKVPDNTELALLLTPNSGYQGGTIYVDGNPLTGNTYQVIGDVTFTAEGITRIPDPEPDPVPPVYHTVTIPAVEGAVTDPIAGQYDVESWSSFRFYLTLDKDYDQSEPVVTTDRGETIQPRSSDGAYIVKYVRCDVKITIDGIVKNPDPVANAEIQSGTKAWVNNHQLFIRTDKQEKVFIYAFDGKLRKTFLSAGGEEHVALSSGSYIVRIGQNNFKVIL